MYTLRYGSRGHQVATLQASLNLLPSQYVELAVDHIFGPKTYARVMEHQKIFGISIDGIVGKQTWGTLKMVLGVLDNIVIVHRKRESIVKAASDEARGSGANVAAKKPGSYDSSAKKHFRRGHKRLEEYFSLAARGVFDDDAVTYLTTEDQLAPCPHWCGIFALWAHKKAGVQVGNWKIGQSFSAISSIRVKSKHDPVKGDVGCVIRRSPDGRSFNHYVLIKRVYLSGTKWMMDTVEGNTGNSSNVRIRTGLNTSNLVYVYTAF